MGSLALSRAASPGRQGAARDMLPLPHARERSRLCLHPLRTPEHDVCSDQVYLVNDDDPGGRHRGSGDGIGLNACNSGKTQRSGTVGQPWVSNEVGVSDERKDLRHSVGLPSQGTRRSPLPHLLINACLRWLHAQDASCQPCLLVGRARRVSHHGPFRAAEQTRYRLSTIST